MKAAGHLFLISLATGFFVILEPAPTDLAFILAFMLVFLGMQVHMPQAIHTYAVLTFLFLLTNSASAMACTHFVFCFRYLAITIYLFLVPILMVHLVTSLSPRYLSAMYTAFFTAIFISAMAGILARFGLLPGPTTLYFREDAGLRLSPFFKDPNVYAPYLGAGLILFLGHVIAWSRNMWFGLLGITVMWFPLLLAFSRAAWLAIAAASVVFLLTMVVLGSGQKAGRRFLKIVCLVLFVVVPLSAVGLYVTGLLDFFSHRLAIQSYDTHRFATHAKSIGIAFDNPFGIGPGHFVGKSHFPQSQFDFAAHNVYAKVWVENGFAGLALFLAIILWAMRDILRVARLRTERFPIHVALFAALAGIMVNGYFIDTLHWRHLFVLLGFVFAEVYVTEHSLAHQRRPWRPAPMIHRRARSLA
jgi:O-antigen ligase